MSTYDEDKEKEVDDNLLSADDPTEEADPEEAPVPGIEEEEESY